MQGSFLFTPRVVSLGFPVRRCLHFRQLLPAHTEHRGLPVQFLLQKPWRQNLSFFGLQRAFYFLEDRLLYQGVPEAFSKTCFLAVVN